MPRYRGNMLDFSDCILCTVAKNEEKCFPGLASDVLGQSERPALWVLLDDHSTDQTSRIMRGLAQRYEWIRYHTYEGPASTQLGMHLAELKCCASTLAVDTAFKEKIQFRYIGLLDADVRLPASFYERMIRRMAQNPAIGIISPRILEFADNGELYLKVSRGDLPGCAAMLCRRKCFEDIGGVDTRAYPEDAIMVVRARLRGWQTIRAADIKVIHMRKTSSAPGLKRGYVFEGEKVFFLRYPFLYVLLRAIYIAITLGFDCAYAFVHGYLSRLLNGDERLDDKELVGYFRKTRPREIVKYRLGRLRDLAFRKLPSSALNRRPDEV